MIYLYRLIYNSFQNIHLLGLKSYEILPLFLKIQFNYFSGGNAIFENHLNYI